MQFYHLDKNELDTMIAHINKFKALMQQLAGVKKKVEEDGVAIVLLNSVNKVPYDSLVSTLKNVDKSLSEIEYALLELELKKKDKASVSDTQLLYVKGGKHNLGPLSRCFYCGKLGHTQNECHNKEKPKIECRKAFLKALVLSPLSFHKKCCKSPSEAHDVLKVNAKATLCQSA